MPNLNVGCSTNLEALLSGVPQLLCFSPGFTHEEHDKQTYGTSMEELECPTLKRARLLPPRGRTVPEAAPAERPGQVFLTKLQIEGFKTFADRFVHVSPSFKSLNRALSNARSSRVVRCSDLVQTLSQNFTSEHLSVSALFCFASVATRLICRT